ELMFPGAPCRAYLMDTNSTAENALVTAHVLGHADFSKNNQLFARFHEMAGGNIVEHAAAHAHRIQQAIDRGGREKVEWLLDAAPALESHVDVDGDLHRTRYPEYRPEKPAAPESAFQRRFRGLPGATEAAKADPGPRFAPPLVHRPLRSRARAVGARHLPHGALRVAVLLSGIRLPDHERGLGLVL